MSWSVPKLGTLVEDPASGGDFTLIEPAGVAEGDLMVACIAYRGNAAITAPSGWSTVATAQNSGDTDATNGIASGVMFYIVRGASAPDLVCTRILGDVVLARVISYSPSAGNVPVYDTGSANTLGAASATATTGTITTAVASELIVAMVSGGDAYTVSAFDAATDPTTASGATDTTTAPTNGTWIERHDSSTATGADGTLAIADAVRATAGATGTIQATVSGSARQVMIAGAFKEVVRTFSQTEAAFYEDGTETGSTVVASGADSITRDVSAGDSNLQLRIRLQNTLANAGLSTDDYQLQYEKNDSGTWLNVDQATQSLLDSYSETNQSNNRALNSVNYQGESQSFVGNGDTLDLAKFYIRKVNSPTGNAVAKIYAVTGTPGTSAKPTGAALATSDNVDVSTLSTSLALVDFNFSGANEITLVNGTNYCLTIEYSGSSGTNTLEVAYDNSSSTHSGNEASFLSPDWFSSSSNDLCFYLYTKSSAGTEVIGFNSASLTDGNATTNRLGAGTGSFVAGKISEDGLVDDLQITASNYTELLYSLTIESTAVANNDTLDFRVLRNGATTGMTYTVTPRITVTSGITIVPADATIGTSLDATTISQDHVITSQDITINLSVDNATIAQNHSLTAQDISVATSADNTAIIEIAVFSPADIAISLSTDAVTINQDHVLTSVDVQTSTLIDTTAIAQNHVLAPDDVSVSLNVDNATMLLNYTLPAADTQNSVTIDTTSIVQNHVLLIDDLGINTSVDTTNIIQNYLLVADDLLSSVAIDGTVVTESTIEIAANDMQVSVGLDVVSLSQNHVFTPDDIAFALSTDTGTIAQNHVLVPSDTLVTISMDSTSMAQVHVITVDDIQNALSADGVTITQNQVVQVNDIAINSLADGTTIDLSLQILPSDELTTLTIDATSITQNHVFNPDDIAFVIGLDEGGASQVHTLAAEDIALLTSVDASAVTVSGVTLTAQDMYVAISEDATSFSQLHTINVNDITNGVLLDSTTVVQDILRGKLKVWNGTEFVRIVPKVWNGSSYDTAVVKTWQGSNWIDSY